MISAISCAFYFRETFFLGDHNSINEIGKLHYDSLKSNPTLFFTDIVTDFDKYGIGSVFEASNSFWGYLRFTLLFKFTAILNLLTKGNFYFNSVIFSSLVFFGHIAFYRIFQSIYPSHKYKIIAACFFIPSIWLYTACIHKDGFIFLSLALISYTFYKYLQPGNKINFKHSIVFLLGILTIFLFRNYVLVALLPAIFTVILCKVFPLKRRLMIAGSYLIYAAFFFLTTFFSNSFNLPEAVVRRKADFANLEKGTTNLPMNDLKADPVSFFKNIPQALNHTLMRPYIWESDSFSIILAGLELLFYQLLFVLLLMCRNKKGGPVNNFTIFSLLFFSTMILIIGYTIPNAGAIVRYRGMIWLFVICPIIGNIDWDKLKRLFGKKAAI